jgi:hypothetical protein
LFVNSAPRIAFTAVVLLIGAARGTPAPGAGPASPGTGTLPELAAALGGLPKWSSFCAVESAYGFKDNLLLSAADEERSAFARAAVEALLMRVPTGPVDYSLFTQIEGRHFFSGQSVHNESSVWVRSEFGYRVNREWSLFFPVTGYYDDKVFDQSDTEVERLTAELQVTGGMAAPAVRWAFHPGWWIETQATVQRDRHADHISDHWTKHAGLRLNWSVRAGVDLGASVIGRWRDFDTRAQYSAAGRELIGTRLQVRENEGFLSLVLKWGRHDAWQATTRAGVLDYGDNGSGYFDHREGQLEQEVEWNRGDWLVRGRAAARRVEFGVQTVGISVSPPSRVKDEYEASLRVERKVGARWTIVGGYNWERARSNDTLASYVVNEGLLGVRWSWER